VTAKPQGEVLNSISQLLHSDPRQLGQVYRLIEAGATSADEIIQEGAAKNSGVVSNLRACIRSLTKAEIPVSASVSRQAAAAIGYFLKTEGLSDATIAYLTDLRIDLHKAAHSASGLKVEAKEIASADERLNERSRNLPGVYVFSYLTQLQHPVSDDDPRVWLKVGTTSKSAWKRILAEARQTAMPEDPQMLRIYHSDRIDPETLERKFHNVLDAAGHERSSAVHTQAGKEWFRTSLDMLDSLATALDIEIERF